MSFTIFYSWQSDLPNATNRGFIQTALEKSATTLRRDEAISVEPRVDHSTLGVPGAPEIAQTIFGKIDECQLFVGDVSIINHGDEGRRTPNPNVLVELGYALKSRGHERVILIMNTAYGDLESLPFDLKTRKVFTYTMPQEEVERSGERRALEQRLTAAIHDVINHHERTASPPAPAAPSLAECTIEAIGNGAPQQIALVGDYMAELGKSLDQLAPNYDAAEKDKMQLDDALLVSLDKSKGVVEEFARLTKIIASSNANEAARAVFEGFRHVLERYEPLPLPPGEMRKFRDIAPDFYKFLGHELFVIFLMALIGSKRWTTIADLLSDPIYVGRDRHGEAAFLHFTKVSKPIKLLEFRKQRTSSRQTSLQADILNTRHTEGLFAKAVPANEFMDADYFLLLRSLVEVEEENIWQVWLAHSTLYLGTRAPRFLIESERVALAQAVAEALGVGDIVTMRERIESRGGAIQTLFPQAYTLNPLRGVEFAKIGSRT